MERDVGRGGLPRARIRQVLGTVAHGFRKVVLTDRLDVGRGQTRVIGAGGPAKLRDILRGIHIRQRDIGIAIRSRPSVTAGERGARLAPRPAEELRGACIRGCDARLHRSRKPVEGRLVAVHGGDHHRIALRFADDPALAVGAVVEDAQAVGDGHAAHLRHRKPVGVRRRNPFRIERGVLGADDAHDVDGSGECRPKLSIEGTNEELATLTVRRGVVSHDNRLPRSHRTPGGRQPVNVCECALVVLENLGIATTDDQQLQRLRVDILGFDE